MNAQPDPIKVAFILPAFYRNGAVNLIVNLAEHLTSHNIEVELFAVRECEQRSPLPKAPVKFKTVLKEYQSTLSGLPKLLYRLVRSVLNADVVAYTWENGILIPGIIAFVLRKPTIAIVQNNIQRVSENADNRDRERTIRRWVYNRCQAIVCVGNGLTSTIEPGIDSAKVMPIQNGINVEKVRRLSQAACPAQITKFIEDDTPFIIGVGRLTSQKGFDLLIRAHAAAINQGAQHKLVLIGEGEQKDDLSRLVKELGVSDSVVFLGYLSNPYPVIAQATLFCLSSRYEGFVLVGAEAAALGVPTVATNCVSGPKELLLDGLYGDLVAVDSVGELAIAIQRHLENPQRLIEKASASAQKADRLSMKLCASRYSELLHRCAGQ